MERRKLLSLVCGSAILYSGCVTDRSKNVGLSKVGVINTMDEEIQAEIKIIKNNGEGELKEIVNFSPNGIKEYTRDWMGTPASYTASVETADRYKQTITTENIGKNKQQWGNNTCADILFSIEQKGVSVFIRGVNCSEYKDN